MSQFISQVADRMSEAFTAFPWIVILVIYIGDKLELWGVIRIVRDALQRAQDHQVGGTPTVAPAPKPAPTLPKSLLPPPTPAPAHAPAPSGPFADAPNWFTLGLHEIGFHETGNNQGIGRYIAMAHCGGEGQPWCAIFANAMLEQSGIHGTRSPSSQSFRSDPNFVQLSGPALGALVVFWRGAPTSGLGHVGFYRGEDANHVWTLGGNENDMVQIEALAKASASFGLIGYWWPKSVPLPKGGPIIMPAGSPVHLQSPPTGIPATSTPAPQPAPNGKQTRIVATMFGGQQSAYGGPINDNAPGVALPFRFSGERPLVRVTNVNTGASVECEIVDVGPWNINDPYWEHGSRPQAESGTDMTGRKTNKAGIDLTLAAAKAVQIDGKGLVDWEFLPSPTPTVT
jgi:uncharacterized protein (TIGR02594 family)